MVRFARGCPWVIPKTGETKKQTTYSFVRPGIWNDFSFVWSIALELMLHWMQGDPKHHDASSCGRATGKDIFAKTFWKSLPLTFPQTVCFWLTYTLEKASILGLRGDKLS